jgi:hypothetical protein
MSSAPGFRSRLSSLSDADLVSTSIISRGYSLRSSFACISASATFRRVCFIISGDTTSLPFLSGTGTCGLYFSAMFLVSSVKRMPSRASVNGSMINDFFTLTVRETGNSSMPSALSAITRALAVISPEPLSRSSSKQP